MIATMMNVPLSLNHLLERAGSLFPAQEILSRMPDKSLRRHSFADYYRRTPNPRFAACFKFPALWKKPCRSRYKAKVELHWICCYAMTKWSHGW